MTDQQAAKQSHPASTAGSTDEKPAGKPEEKVDLRNLQDKFHALLDQRNEYNQLANGARDERNLLNEQRRTKSLDIDQLKQRRDELNEKMRAHKEVRNTYQDQAKALIAQKKGKTGALERSLPLQVRKLRNDLQEAIQTQQTSSLSPQKEKVLVEKIRDMWLELKGREKELESQKAVEVDLTDTDQAIDSLFAKADEEHVHVVTFQKEAQAAHEKFVVAVKEVRLLVSESNRKHQEFVAYKAKADDYHNRAMELREKVMAVRDERKAEYDARKKEVTDYNRQVHRNVMDEKAIEKAKDREFEALKKGGKISLGGW